MLARSADNSAVRCFAPRRSGVSALPSVVMPGPVRKMVVSWIPRETSVTLIIRKGVECLAAYGAEADDRAHDDKPMFDHETVARRV